jgi:molecular chaperone GrpE
VTSGSAGTSGDLPDRATGSADETEVEASVVDAPTPGRGPDDISGVDNWVEEGGPLEPQDLAEVDLEPSGATGPSPEAQLAERTADLQRLQAEYANYRKRVDRDRQMVAENATYQALVPIVDVLDTVDRAREHATTSGESLDEGLRAVADQLERAVAGRGLSRFGEPGDPFDPNLHEALSHLGEDPDVQVTTVKQVVKAGYRIGDRVVRAAQVLVVDPA